MKDGALSPLEVTIEIRMSYIEKGCQKLHIQDWVPAFQNLCIPRGGETASQESTVQVIHFIENELQATQLVSRPTEPFPHMLFATKFATLYL